MCVSGEWLSLLGFDVWSEARQETNHDLSSLKHPANLQGTAARAAGPKLSCGEKKGLSPSLAALYFMRR